jgi:hypothetical protein
MDPKNTYPRPGQQLQIGPLEKDELKSPNRNIGLGDAPYVNRDGGTITFESTGPKVGKGEVPNDVQARYRKFVNHAKKTGKKIPYLEYNGKRWYYQSRGKSLTNLETKLKVVADKTAREHAKTPTLDEYKEVFGEENGTRLFNEEQDAMSKLTPGKKKTKTPKGYSRGHIRADAEGGRWHTRNLRLEGTERNAQQRQQVLTPEVENSLMVGGNTNQEFIATQGPRTTPRQTQAILQNAPDVSRMSIKGGVINFNTKGLIGRGLARAALPSVLGGAASLALGAGDVQAREERAQQDPSFINKLQAGLARTEQAADVAGMVPGPQTAVAEPVGFGAGLTNVAIDVARDPMGTLKAVGGGLKYLANEYVLRGAMTAP